MFTGPHKQWLEPPINPANIRCYRVVLGRPTPACSTMSRFSLSCWCRAEASTPERKELGGSNARPSTPGVSSSDTPGHLRKKPVAGGITLRPGACLLEGTLWAVSPAPSVTLLHHFERGLSVWLAGWLQVSWF